MKGNGGKAMLNSITQYNYEPFFVRKKGAIF